MIAKTLLLMLFSSCLTTGIGIRARDDNHAENSNRPPANSKLCVCQYQAEPSNCETAKTGEDCAKIHDCRMIQGNRKKPECVNFLKEYCDRGYYKEVAKLGCSEIKIVSSNERIPNCNHESFFYQYSGHGRGTTKFLDSIEVILARANPECKKIDIQDLGCSTFDINTPDNTSSLYEARDHINQWSRALVKPGQVVTVRGNQKYGSVTFEESNYHDPYFELRFDRYGINKESVPKCKDIDEWACSKKTANQFYLCEGEKGRKRRTCCCQNGKSSWKSDTLKCPEDTDPNDKCGLKPYYSGPGSEGLKTCDMMFKNTPCDEEEANISVRCTTKDGIKRNTCCCKGGKCSWTLNILQCPK